MGSFWRKRISKQMMVCLGIICCCLVFVGQMAEQTATTMLPVDGKIIVLDAGHGGFDPGKVGTLGEDEKHINLAIMTKTQQYLEQGGAIVYVTRLTDEALGSTKQEDMKERQRIANETEGDLLVSIHQNAFPSTSVKGAQVFYHGESTEGKQLAECVQEQLRLVVDADNTRQAKANSDYYVLRTTNIPAVIVECGFLSNPEEEQNLNNETYQSQVAWAIYKGIVEYYTQTEMM
ncbi:N-acetylmuramoyl-L-alanine amidase [Chakrabartyella piscis]|uniref:N-acetylmuramoyl-L-alanine amidase n=1 Tax=Chakrabartyella piscis TaxID=2918914 RepID=UPI002958834F|nr:N-acetylmuramoyl-L-alanine amidase [Chakrabartyella piscis]